MNRPKVYRPAKSYKASSRQHHRYSGVSQGKKLTKRNSKISWFIKWLLIVTGASLSFVLIFTIYFILFTPYSGPVNSAPVVNINLTSEPAGARVFLAGKEKGVTPVSFNLPVGIHSIEFRKNGYSSYLNRLEITAHGDSNNSVAAQSLVAVTSNAAGTVLPAVSLTQTKTNVSTNAIKPLPSFSLNAGLWPDHLVMQPLPLPFPEARLEYARFLNSELIELTYLNKEGEPLLPGSEGLPTNLWIYKPQGGSHPSPVLLTYSSWRSLASYYGIDIGGEAANSSNNWLSRIAVTNPVVSPEGSRLAFISSALTVNNSSLDRGKGNSGAAPALPAWNDQAVWISPLSPTLSSGGATLAGADTSLGPVKLFSLANLVQLLPGFSPLPQDSTAASTGQRFATIKGINWSPDGNSLLAVIEINEASLTGSRTGTGNNTPVSILALVSTVDTTSPGRLTLVTPQPLTEQILPGTLSWSADGSAVSFLVSQDQYSSGTRTQVGLCVLDLGSASRLNNYVGETQTVRSTPLRYLAQVNQTGVWNNRSSYRSSNQAGGRVYPPAYGSFRYSPFAWPVSVADNQTGEGLSLTELSKKGLYSAAGQAGSNSTNSPVSTSNLYTYFREDQSTRPVIDETTSPKAGSDRNATITNSKLPQGQGKAGSYPLWLGGQNPFYFVTRQIVIDKDNGDQDGLFGSGSSVPVWQLFIDSLSFPSEINQNGPRPVTSAPGVSVRLLEDHPGPVTLSLSKSPYGPIPGLAPGRFEAQWRPDGLAALVALPAPPSSPANQGNQVWLVRWDNN